MYHGIENLYKNKFIIGNSAVDSELVFLFADSKQDRKLHEEVIGIHFVKSNNMRFQTYIERTVAKV